MPLSQWTSRLALAVVVSVAVVTPTVAWAVPATVPGLDVSAAQGTVDWPSVFAAGYRFAGVSAADGTSQNPSFASQWAGAKGAGLLRAAYFFAEPVFETGTTHADWFLNQIGYTADGQTLPPVLDVERNPNQAACDGLSVGAWVAYVSSFTAEVRARTGVSAIIYTNPDTWINCLGNSTQFHGNPLWVADWGVSSPTLFGGWSSDVLWQYGGGSVAGVSVDLDTFNGSLASLHALAAGNGGSPYQVVGTSGGLAVQTEPHVDHVVSNVANGTVLYVVCQTNHGDQVDGATQYGRPFTTWDQLAGGEWVYDWYMNTPTVGTNGYSPGIPACSGG